MSEYLDGEYVLSSDEMEYSTELSPENLKDSQEYPIVVCYKLLDFDKSNYSFTQSFSERDSFEYFQAMKILSTKTINEIMDDTEFKQKHHFRLSTLRGNLLKEFKKVLGKKQISENSAMFFHFALYTSKNKADRKTKVRSPRIYFILGLFGTIYPIFFDPYHELNPIKD